MTNEWDGMTHDYTRKGGIVHAEIMLPAHAPPEFADRSILWNSVEQIEKARDSQLAREIEAALPRELSGEQQLALVRAYVKDNFVDKGMCADSSRGRAASISRASWLSLAFSICSTLFQRIERSANSGGAWAGSMISA